MLSADGVNNLPGDMSLEQLIWVVDTLFKETLKRYVEQKKLDFDNGNKAVLLETLTLYLDYEILPPPWISNELSKGASGISGAKSWDDIFGKFPLTRNKKIER
jgi:hypothetical protein